MATIIAFHEVDDVDHCFTHPSGKSSSGPPNYTLTMTSGQTYTYS